MNWPHVWEMMQAFHASVSPAYGIDEADARAVMGEIEAHGFLKVTDGGFIAGTVVENPLKRSERIGKEFLWWSRDGSGAALQRDFRRWCIEQGATLIDWSCPPENDRVRRFYSRFSTPSEVVYTEVL